MADRRSEAWPRSGGRDQAPGHERRDRTPHPVAGQMYLASDGHAPGPSGTGKQLGVAVAGAYRDLQLKSFAQSAILRIGSRRYIGGRSARVIARSLKIAEEFMYGTDYANCSLPWSVRGPELIAAGKRRGIEVERQNE